MNTEQALRQQTMKWKLYPSQETSSFLSQQKIFSLSVSFLRTSSSKLHLVNISRRNCISLHCLLFWLPEPRNHPVFQCQQKVTSCKQFPSKLHFPVGIALLCTALHPGRTNKVRRVESKVQTGNALGNCLQT